MAAFNNIGGNKDNIKDNQDDKVSTNELVLNIYGYESGYSKYACQGKRTSCNTVIATIEVNNENANIIHIWNNYVLYFDNKQYPLN